SAPPMWPTLPRTAGRTSGSANWFLYVPSVAGLQLGPAAHPPHAARPPFHTDGRNQTGAMPHQRSCEQRWLARHSSRQLATAQPQHSSRITATEQAHAGGQGLTPRPRLLPLGGTPAPLVAAAVLDTSLPGQQEDAGS